MAFASVFRGLGGILVVLAALAFIAALFGAAVNERPQALTLSATGLLSLFLGISGFLLGRNLQTNTGPREGVAMLLLGWTIAPAIAAFGFLGQGAIIHFDDAFFEAMSAATTTGASLIDPDTAPRSIILWRGLLEWGGGYLSILMILVILVALNLTGPGVHRSTLFTLDKEGLFKRFSHITRVAGVIYGIVTLVTFIGLAVSGSTLFDAVCLALSAPATGGGAPRGAALPDYVSGAGLMVLGLALFAGSLNYALLWEAYRDNVMRRDILRDPETRALSGGILLIFVLLVFMSSGLSFGRLSIAFHDAAALISTSGRFADLEAMRALPPTLLMAAVLIGGSALSTAGGVKIIRVLLLVRHARAELRKLSHPSSIQLVHFRDRVVPDRTFVSLWIYFLGYTAVLGVLIVGIATMGEPLDIALPAAVATLSNAGPLLYATAAENADFNQFTRGARAVMSAGMALGRMEVLAALAALAPGLWRR
ncbi:TrkH family potassium uptake protein [Euryhalocaulis caribicus]|uniref:TrkH family potassium uptake protein n=1 Tax=Euryhalocaulis caribicus TaxID=1161401 RepID=UPI00039BA7BC|nr:potassium transporter TrkG [Euryhalocaulis caribicus]